MPSKINNNVVGHKLIDNGVVVEDITSVSLPNLEHPTETVSSNGMVADVDVPNPYHYNAMEFTVSHNNGANCNQLATPDLHAMELRVARQVYNVATAKSGNESVKYRITGMHKGSEKGTVENNNPLGSTEKYSVLRFEEEINGEVVTLIDAMAGIVRINGTDYGSSVDNLLN